MYVSARVHSLVQSRTLGLVAGEPGEDVALVPGPQRRGGGGSVAVSGPDKEQGGRKVKEGRTRRVKNEGVCELHYSQKIRQICQQNSLNLSITVHVPVRAVVRFPPC